MSTLSVTTDISANLAFESTGNNTIALTSSNTVTLKAGGATSFIANGSGVFGAPITTANSVVFLNNASKLPAVDGSLLTNLTLRTLLATLTTTSGTTQTATGLSPSSYRYYEIELVGVSGDNNNTSIKISTSGDGGTNYGSAMNLFSANLSNASDTAEGTILLYGINGAKQYSPSAVLAVSTTAGITPMGSCISVPKHSTGATSPVDAIKFSLGPAATAFDAGTIRIYGVK